MGSGVATLGHAGARAPAVQICALAITLQLTFVLYSKHRLLDDEVKRSQDILQNITNNVKVYNYCGI